MSSPREREKRDRRESRGDEREGQGRKRNRNESEETEEIKTFPSTLTHYKDSRPCPTVSQYQLDAPVMKDTQHLCTTRPPPTHEMSRLFSETKIEVLEQVPRGARITPTGAIFLIIKYFKVNDNDIRQNHRTMK